MMYVLEGFNGDLPSFPEHVHIPSRSLVARIRRSQWALMGQDFSELPHPILSIIVVDEVEEVVVGHDLFPSMVGVMTH
jgi:hypothetical protein